jgi:hypothetical protein
MLKTMLVIGAVLGLLLESACGGSADADRAFRRSTACGMAERFVKDALKAPSTASFQDCQDVTVSQVGSTWTLSGYVDAQNAFSAKLRNPYLVEMVDTGKGNWELVRLAVSDKVLVEPPAPAPTPRPSPTPRPTPAGSGVTGDTVQVSKDFGVIIGKPSAYAPPPASPDRFESKTGVNLRVNTAVPITVIRKPNTYTIFSTYDFTLIDSSGLTHRQEICLCPEYDLSAVVQDKNGRVYLPRVSGFAYFNVLPGSRIIRISYHDYLSGETTYIDLNQ